MSGMVWSPEASGLSITTEHFPGVVSGRWEDTHLERFMIEHERRQELKSQSFQLSIRDVGSGTAALATPSLSGTSVLFSLVISAPLFAVRRPYLGPLPSLPPFGGTIRLMPVTCDPDHSGRSHRTLSRVHRDIIYLAN